jgi:DNA polymerase III epsilon subunit-like protein
MNNLNNLAGYVCLDLETTQLVPTGRTIVQIGVCWYDFDGELRHFESLIVRDRWDVDIGALNVWDEELRVAWQKGLGASVDFVAAELNEMLFDLLMAGRKRYGDKWKLTMVGKNVAAFDRQHLLADPDLSGVLRHFNHRDLDVGALWWRPDDPVVPNLSQCLARSGVESVVRHTALADAKQTLELLVRHR